MREEERVAAIVADWVASLEDGETLDLEGLVRQHPELEDGIRRGFAAMALMDFALDKEPVVDAAVPDRIGAYRIQEVLGDGGMGTVYKATAETRTEVVPEGATVAIKCIHPHLLRTPGFNERFQREADLGQQIQHPNVVRTYGASAVGTTDGRGPILVMEYVEGQRLESLGEELGCVPEELCRHVGQQIADGLHAIHLAGAVHRDLKPANVLITHDHEVKIMDLGVAWLAEAQVRLSQTGVFLGSLLYASPEQFQGADVDGRSDLYALGLVLYELACNAHPFRADDSAQVIRQQLERTPRPLGEVNPQISPFFERVVDVLLQKSPSERVGSASDLANILDEGESGKWWRQQARFLCQKMKRPLRRIRIPRETDVYGREDDVAWLRDAYQRASGGEGQVLLIEGEAGIGKTRLVDEFVGRLRESGEDFNFVFGAYPPGGAATAAGAFSTAYREHLEGEGLEAALAVHLSASPALIPALASLLRGAPKPKEAEPLTQASLQTAFTHVTRSLAGERVTVVMVDDLHFAPEEGRSLFASLAMAVPDHRILLIGTMRPGAPAGWTTNLKRLDHTAHRSLARIGPRDLASLLEDAFHSRKLAERLGIQIARKADGNPFFALEIIRGLREGQLIARRPDGTWDTTQAVLDIKVPDSVLDLVNARVADLSELERDILDAASCCGFEFDPLLVSEALGLERVLLLKQLAQLERRHRLVRASGSKYVFDHHQVQEALYTSMSRPLQEIRHASLANALAVRSNALDASLEELDGALCVQLCHHYLRGTEPERALRYVRAAVSHLQGTYVHEQALDLADHALQVPGLLQGRFRADILLLANRSLDVLGRRETQEVVLAEAHALARGGKEPAYVSHVEEALAILFLRTGRLEQARESFERLLKTAESAEDKQRECFAAGNLSAVLATMGRNEDAKVLCERQLRIAREAGNRYEEATASGNHGVQLLREGLLDEAREHLERSLSIARQIRSRRPEMRSMSGLGLVMVSLGRIEDAQRYYEGQLAIAREIGERREEATALGDFGLVFWMRGDHSQALEHFDMWAEMSREIGDRIQESMALVNSGVVLLALGRFRASISYFERSAAIGREIRSSSREAYALVNLGPAWAGLGALCRAREVLEAALCLCEKTGDRYPQGYALQGLANVAAEAGDDARALDLTGEALALRRTLGPGQGLTVSLIRLAELEAWRGDEGGARHALEEAVELLREQGEPAQLAEAQALLASLPGGDTGAAEEALSKAGDAGNAPSVRYYLWKATGKHEHLQEAKRLLDYRVEHAPEEYRESMLKNVRVNREIMEAWAEHGEKEENE